MSLQDLRELKDYLLDGIKVIEPRAVECKKGTRTSILSDIISRVDDHDGANVIWIRGAPGSGKSSISLTAKSLLQRQRQLITYFRFDRNETGATTSTALWRRVAYDLGRRFPSARIRLLQLLREDEVDLDSAITVFTSLVDAFLSEWTDPLPDHPLVIIIDALDECGGPAARSSTDRAALLKTLGFWSKFPKCFKLLVTSRLEGDVTRVLSSISTQIDIPSGNVLNDNSRAQPSIEASNDILSFLECRFEQIRAPSSSLSTDWPGRDMVTKMVCRAAGNFMWATTATNFIDSGIDPEERLEIIIGYAPESKSMEPLYFLYSTILETSFGTIAEDSTEAEVLRTVLGVIVFARRPFHDTEYMKLPTSTPVRSIMIDMIRDRLRSVIDLGPTLRFVHKSFDDFLLSKECPSKYAIRTDESQYLLTSLCLTTMAEGLHFNMCHLETSYFKNADVPEIEIKVTNGIPPLLTYSCYFFAEQLSVTPFDEHLMARVKDIIMDRMLYWFEAMSLLKEMNRVSKSLLLVLKWSHPSPDDEFKDFLQDARQFVGAFIRPIAQSAPHVYLSALPFAPEHSLVANHFLPRFPRIIALSTGRPTNWSPCIFTMEHHNNGVSCVTFSQDEKYFASGSRDKSICICDSETGNLVSGPFRGDGTVLGVSFDPDGCRVVASYFRGKVICWDIETGNKQLVINTSEVATYCRFSGTQKIIAAGKTTIAMWSAETGIRELRWDHIRDVTHVSISPDSRSIACASQDDSIIKIWKVVDRSKFQCLPRSQPQFKHAEAISAVSISVDGSFAASGSKDGTILIWNIMTGNVVGPSMATEAVVNAVAYAPSQHLLVSSSGETGAITVWNALTHEAVLGPLQAHTSAVREIVLSYDGRRALSASLDGTVKMWDLGRKETMPMTLSNKGHGDNIMCITFSPCGKKLASVDRQTIRVWDMSTGEPLLRCDTRKRYEKIIFSPGGGQIVAYCNSNDGTVEVWNSNTGELIVHLDLGDDGCPRTLIRHASFRSTDQRLITCSSNNVVRIWKLKDGAMTKDDLTSSPQPVHTGKPISIIALSPDGLTAIIHDSGRNPYHYIWSTITHQPLPLIFADDDHVSGYPVVYSPSGQYVVSAYNFDEGELHRMLRVWDTQCGRLIARLITFDDRICSALAFSPDNRHIAISYYTPPSESAAIWILDVHAGHLLSGPWSGHSDNISTLTFSPDGRKLVSGSRDHQIRVWDCADLFGESQVSSGFLGVGTYMEDGWVKDSDGKLLFWVPRDHRARLAWPQSVLFDGSGISTKLDLSRFRYGECWAECFTEGKYY